MSDGASEEQIRQVEEALEFEFPSELRDIYCESDGAGRADSSLRLMTLQELLEIDSWTHESRCRDLGMRLIWTDDNSNFIGLYVDGPAAPRLCVFDHEEPNFAPRWRSIESFLLAEAEAVDAELAEWYDFRTDYPEVEPHPEFEARDLDDAMALRERFLATDRSDDVRWHHLAYACMALIPLPHTDALLEFLDVEDMWIPEMACRLVGQRHWAAAVPQLITLARRLKPNSGLAAIGALQRIPGNEQTLAQLRSEAPKDFRPWFDPPRVR